MADYQQIVPLFLDKEGGLSKAATDTASKDPSPCTIRGEKGWHTNKGVTWTTFKSLAPKLGYTPSCKNFEKMPASIWSKIFKAGYWDKWGLDKMKSQPVADTIVWWSWGSGNYGARKSFTKFLKTKHGITAGGYSSVAAALNTLAIKDEKKLFDQLTNWRISFYEGLNQPSNLKGWKNAYKRFVSYATGYLGKLQKYGVRGVGKSFMHDPLAFTKRNWIPMSALGVGIVGLGIMTYFLVKKK